MKFAAIFLSSVSFLIQGAGFLGIISQSDAHKGMIVVMLLYVINGYYGIKMSLEVDNI